MSAQWSAVVEEELMKGNHSHLYLIISLRMTFIEVLDALSMHTSLHTSLSLLVNKIPNVLVGDECI